MASPVTSDAEFAAAVAQILSHGANGNLDKDRCQKAQDWLRKAPDRTVTVPITAA